MKELRAGFFVSLAIIFVANSTLFATTQYQITDLGSGYAYSVNNNGQVVGRVGTFYSGQATLFDTAGQGNNINLGNGTAYSINDNGQAVGMWFQSFSPPTYKAMNYKPYLNGTYTAEVMGDGTAYSVDNNGQMVGGSNGNAVIFTYNETLHQYQTTSLASGEALANSNNGQIAGTRGSTNKAILWNPNGSGGYSSTNLGTLSGYDRSRAYAMNNNGQIIGAACKSWPPGSDPDLESTDYRATLFDASGGGQNIYLGSLSGYADSWARGINDNGEIVGACFNHTPGAGFATLFDPTGNGNNIDLNTVLVNPLSGCILREAYSINNDGWIVGYMYTSGDGFHAFLLTPVPEPTTFALLGLGALILRKRK
jgi:uncharacterized membrane protein